MQVQCHHHAQPYRVDSHQEQGWGDDRHHNESDLDEVQEEPKGKHDQHDHNQGCDFTARQIGQQITDDVVTPITKEHERKEGNYLMRERRTGSFHRSLRLPDTVDVDNAAPTYDEGVLTISFPKAESKRAKHLTVTTGKELEAKEK